MKPPIHVGMSAAEYERAMAQAKKPEREMSGVDVEALRKLERAATPGPWEADEDAWILASDDDRGFVAQVFDGLRPTATDETSALANAAFIAAARNAFPAMADEIERLRKALAAARRWIVSVEIDEAYDIEGGDIHSDLVDLIDAALGEAR